MDPRRAPHPGRKFFLTVLLASILAGQPNDVSKNVSEMVQALPAMVMWRHLIKGAHLPTHLPQGTLPTTPTPTTIAPTENLKSAGAIAVTVAIFTLVPFCTLGVCYLLRLRRGREGG